MFDDHNDFNKFRDLGANRVIELDNNKLHVQRKDPYGFWEIHFDKGQIPDDLKGRYTSFDEAKKAIDVYLREKKREIKAVTK